MMRNSASTAGGCSPCTFSCCCCCCCCWVGYDCDCCEVDFWLRVFAKVAGALLGGIVSAAAGTFAEAAGAAGAAGASAARPSTDSDAPRLHSSCTMGAW